MDTAIIGSKYTLLRRLASGGMAEVFLARQSGLVGFEKLVVIKRILPHLAEQMDFVKMFLDEARTAADLRHPNVIDVYEVGEHEGTYYMAMEFLQGQHLRRIEQTARDRDLDIPLSIAVQIIVDCAQGLHYAHIKKDSRGTALGIVHRDVSPHNIVVTYEGAVKIVDFGIAKARNQMTATAPGVVKGKIAYLSPEQARGEPLDARSDLFSLGIVLYELTTGRRLFLRTNEAATLKAILEVEVPSPDASVPDYPEGLQDIVMKALAPIPEDRFENCAELATALHDFRRQADFASSTVEVADFMRDLFADLIERETENLHRASEESGEQLSEGTAPTLVSASEYTREASQAIAPRGLVTLVFTDIEGSTNMWERHATAMEKALETHNDIFRARLLELNGYEVKTEGDAFMVAFSDVLSAVKWCLTVQEDLLAAEWPEELLTHEKAQEVTSGSGILQRGIRVRMGIHLGRPAAQPNPLTGRMDYFGPTVNRAARVADAAHGGQVLVTNWVLREIEPRLAELGDPIVKDMGEHRLRGLDSAVNVAQVLPRKIAERTFPRLRTLETRKTNLTQHPAQFVGRSADLDSLHELVGRGERLVTLLGPGGTGKTRLAMQYGWLHLADYGEEGGVWIFDLTDARTVDGMCKTFGGVLGVPLTSGNTAADMVQQLGHAIAGRGKTLLILDNFEQVVQFGPETVAQWMALAPKAQFLVTSQATLKLPGELVQELAPLTLPAEGADPAESEAVQLFVERARGARSNFELTEENGPIIAEIVLGLDGLPLAIELAAARIKVFSPAKLRDRLGRRFDLLKGARRDVTDRQATLRGAIDWSWNLLEPFEQSAMAQCSVFRGGFTVEAAEEVLDLSAFEDAPWAVDVVQSLRERSLLRTYESSEAAGELRFGCYESIRQYAQEKLEAEGETSVDTALARHAAFYLVSCADWAQAIETRGDVERLEELQLEVENLRAIHARAIGREPSVESATESVRAVLTLDPVLAARGPFGSHVKGLDEAVEHAANVEVDPELRARLLLARGKARRSRGDLEGAQEDFAAAREHAQVAGAGELDVVALVYGGTVRQSRGELDDAKTAYESGLEKVRDLGDQGLKGFVLGCLGTYHHEQGRMDSAQRLYEQAVALLKTAGDRSREAIYAANLGLALIELAQLDRARENLLRALEIHREIGERRREGRVLSYLAHVQHDAGEVDEAMKFYWDALAVSREVGDRTTQGMVTGYLASLFHLQGELDDALDLYEKARDILHAADYKRNEGLFLAYLAAARADRGETDQSTELFATAQELLDGVGDPALLATIEVLRGHLDLAQGDDAAAQGRIDAARTPDPEGTSLESGSADVRFALRMLEGKR